MNIWSDYMFNKMNMTDILYLLLVIFTLFSFVLLLLLIRHDKSKKQIRKNEVTLEEDIINIIDVEESNNTSKSNLEDLLGKMQQDLENKNTDFIKSFEDEQEEKSIISYQELLAANKKTNNTPIENENIETVEINENEKKFKNSDFISPIYGRVNKEVNYPKIPSFKQKTKEDIKEEIVILDEETKNVSKQISVERIEKEIKRSEQFLQALKDFRKNLE